MKKLIFILIMALSIMGCEDDFIVINLIIENDYKDAIMYIGPVGGKAIEYDLPKGAHKEMCFEPNYYYIGIVSEDCEVQESYVNLTFSSITTIKFEP